MQKDNTKSYWLVSGLYALFEKGGSQLFGLGSLLMLIRTLEQDDWGVWGLFLVVCALLEVTRIGLIQNALVKFLSAEKATEHGKINTASLFLNFSLTILFSLLLLILAPFFGQLWDESIIPLLNIYALTTLVLTPMYQSNFILQANLSFKGIFLSNMVRQGSFFFFILYLWLLDKPIILSEMAQFQVLAAGLGSLIAVYHAWQFFNFSKQIDWNWIKKLIDFGKYAVSTNLSVILYKNMDKMMLGAMISTASVAVYDLAIRITNLMDIPTSSAAAVVFPQSAREMVTKGKDGVKKMYEQSVGAILALLVPLILFVEIFPEFIILIIAGEAYLSAVPLLRITILFGLFLPFGSQMGTVLESIGKPNINFYCTLLGFVLNIIFNFLFISWLGVTGAAYGTLITYMITFVVTQIILYKILKVNTLNVFKYMWEFYQKGFEMAKEKILAFRGKSTATPSV
ncbi:MAG: flippase [Saprospiraceae bacterium]